MPITHPTPLQTRRLVGVAATLVTLAFATASAALAHAQLVSVEPAEGAHLATSPAEVAVTFDEPVGLAPGGLRVLDSSGLVMDSEDDVVDGSAIRQALEPLPDGWYVVTWGIISEDGHVVRASSVFAVGDVGAAPASAASQVAWSTPLLGLARAVTDLAVLVAAGAWVAWFLLGARSGRVGRLARLAATLGLVASVVWLGAEATDGGPGWLRTPAGSLGGLRILSLVVAVAATRRWPAVAAGASVMALLSLVGGGHSASSALATVLVGTHLLAAASWLGAAPAVLLVMTDRSVEEPDALRVVQRFSTLAPLVLVTVGLAGVGAALLLTDGFAGGFTTTYVLLLATKVALVATAALIGAIARRRLQASPSRGTMRRVFAVDAVLLPLIVLASAALTLTGPHEGHAGYAEGGRAGTARCATEAGPASISIVATPARAGSNELVIGGVPSSALEVEVRLTHEATADAPLVVVASPEDGSWVAEGILPLAGPWEATVAIRLDSFTQVQGTCSLSIQR